MNIQPVTINISHKKLYF